MNRRDLVSKQKDLMIRNISFTTFKVFSRLIMKARNIRLQLARDKQAL